MSLPGNCISNDTLVGACYFRGICPPGNNITSRCVCEYYYDPATTCKDNLFTTMPAVASNLYYVLIIIWGIICLGLYIPEIIIDLRIAGAKTLKTSTTVTKCALVLYGLLTLSCGVVFCVGYWLDTADYALVQYFLHITSISVILVSPELATIKYLEMLIKAKNLGYDPKIMRVLRIILIVMICVGVPILFLAIILAKIGIAVPVMQAVYTYGALVLYSIALIIAGVYIIKCLHWIRKLSKTASSESKLKSLYRKTLCLLFADLLIIINFVVLSGNPISPAEVLGNLISIYSALFFEILVAMFLWGFIQNHSTNHRNKNIFRNWRKAWGKSRVNSDTPSDNSGSKSNDGKKGRDQPTASTKAGKNTTGTNNTTDKDSTKTNSTDTTKDTAVSVPPLPLEVSSSSGSGASASENSKVSSSGELTTSKNSGTSGSV